MAKKFNTLYYKFTDPLFDKKEDSFINEFMEEGSLQSSCWFKNLNSNISEGTIGKYIPSTVKFISYLQQKCLKEDQNACRIMEYRTLGTAKTCPGVKRVLKNSILVKAPCDIVIDIDSTGRWLWKTPDLGFVELTEAHGPDQFGAPWEKPGSKLFQNKRVIKFKFPFIVRTKEPFIYLQPQFHTDLPLGIVNGVIAPPTPSTFFNIVTIYTLPAEGDTLNISIKKGEVLCYLWGANPIKLKKDTKGVENVSRLSRFLNTYGEGQ
jgi:hypothetical protein